MSGKEYRNVEKTECEEAGRVWVEAHMRGRTYVHSFCRDRTHEEINKMSPLEKKEFEKKSLKLKGYYEGEGPDPLEAINEILRSMDLPYNGGGDEFEYELPNGVYTMSEDVVEKVGTATFLTHVYKNGRYYTLSGNISKVKGRWVASGEPEVIV